MVTPRSQFSRDYATTTGRTRSCFRARLPSELRTGRILQRRLVQTELPGDRTAGRGSRFGAHEAGNSFAYLQLGRTTGRREFCVIRDLHVSLVGKRDPYRVLLHRERGQKFPPPCFVVARLVNLQECRRMRDPLFIDRSSTKPYGRSRSGTRTCLPSAPVLTDLYGMCFLQSICVEPCTTTERILSLPTEACRSCQKTGLLLKCAFRSLVFYPKTKRLQSCPPPESFPPPLASPRQCRSHLVCGWGLVLFLCTFMLLSYFVSKNPTCNSYLLSAATISAPRCTEIEAITRRNVGFYLEVVGQRPCRGADQ